MENTETSKKGFLKKAWGMHGKFTKLLSVSGLLLTTAILPFMAVDAKVANPDANLLDIGTHFYSFAFNTAAENVVPGWGILLNEAFNTVASVTADVIVPGAGAIVNAISPSV